MATQFTIDTSYTDAQMLAFVKQAIIEVVAGGQSYALPGGRQWTGADLAQLHAMETAYQSRVDAESYGMPVNLARGVR